MDLTTLRDSLDSSSRERHPASVSAKRSEVRLTRDFKAAALQLTTLYRTSLATSKRSYAAGYAQSLNDILDVVNLRLQQSPASTPGYAVSVGTNSAESNREELKWLSRYLRARVEAIRAETEDEEKMESDEEDANEGSLAGSVHLESAQPVASQEVEQLTAVQTPTEVHVSEVVTQHPPSRTTFTFTVPDTPTTTTEQTPKARRLRRPESPAMHAQGQAAQNALSAAQQASVDQRRAVLRATSSSDDEDTLSIPSPARSAHNSNRRSGSRTGKRTSGREKLSGLELFARAQNAKRRRGMGDRRDDYDDHSIL